MEALRRATVFVRFSSRLYAPEDPWKDADEKIAALLMPAMTVWIPQPGTEAAAATARGFAEQLIGFLSRSGEDAENAQTT